MNMLDILAGLAQATPARVDKTDDGPISFEAPCDLAEYDRFVVFFSGGKDSVACVLDLIDRGVPRERIELHHHVVDGCEGSNLMDWPCTHSYVQAFGKAMGLRVLFSWKQGGFEREMLRQNCGTAPVVFTRGDGQQVAMGGERSKDNTRLKFPQVSANLAQRWCSSACKVEVGARLLINDPRFTLGKTLVVTGERAEESPNRARYATFEPHRTDNRHGRTSRWIDSWRPVHGWSEKQVWEILERYRINPHPAYHIGFGRASCMCCVFLGPDHWATVRDIAPLHFQRIADYEKSFGFTIHRTRSVIEQADRGTSYSPDPFWVTVAMSTSYTESIFTDHWVLPRGAFGDNSGPS